MNHVDYPNEKLTKMIGLSSRFAIAVPIIGLLFKFWGLRAVNASNLHKLMATNKTIGLVPGGF